MKRLATALVALLLAACGSPSAQPSASPTPTPSATVDTCERFQYISSIASGEGALPDVLVDCLEGDEQVRLSTLRGPMVIAVWASWCQPCKEELPIVQQFYDLHHEQVDVLGYNLLDVSSQAISAAEHWGVDFASVEDPDGVFRPELDITAPPTTLFVDQGGHVVGKHLGAVTSLEELEQLVTQFLAVDFS